MSGLTNQYVEDLGKQIIGSKFIGTFPCDIQPQVSKKKCFSVVFNLSKHDTKGSHFIAIFADDANLMYFDPLGHKCENADILSFITKVKEKRKLKTKFPKIQSCSSIFCGFFCLAFLISRHRKLALSSFFNNFNKKNLQSNDKTVVNFIIDNIY
jgi:hypothetical protein